MAIYSVVIKPNAALSERMMRLMRKLKAQYGISRALDDPKGPHISILYAGEVEFEADSLGKMREICKRYKPIKLSVKGIGYFMKQAGRTRNYVVYLWPSRPKSLVSLYQELRSSFRVRKPTGHPFFPHFSIARTDIDKRIFYSILKNYRNLDFKAEFTVNCLYLCTYKGRGRPKKWKFTKIPLGK
ncbi:MAG: 2'-5' RNA ligase family protein [Candidatus Micrarchaeota archaeon]|nr:2'-5' RNA ligase family protein [Candidatus Micrarchaeota archaeon]